MFANARVIYSFRLKIHIYICICYFFLFMDFFIYRALFIYLCPSQLIHGQNNGMSYMCEEPTTRWPEHGWCRKTWPFPLWMGLCIFSETFAVVLSTECDATIGCVVSSAPESMVQNANHRLAKILLKPAWFVNWNPYHKPGYIIYIYKYLHEEHWKKKQPSMDR